MLCVSAVAERSNHRLLRCLSLRVPGSMSGLACVKVCIKFICPCPAIWVSYEMMTAIKLITAIGTMMVNKQGIPNELEKTDDGEQLSHDWFRRLENLRISLHSFVVANNSTKNILVMNSHPVSMSVTVDAGPKKSANLRTYDFSKGGTDVMDQKMQCYSTNTK